MPARYSATRADATVILKTTCCSLSQEMHDKGIATWAAAQISCPKSHFDEKRDEIKATMDFKASQLPFSQSRGGHSDWGMPKRFKLARKPALSAESQASDKSCLPCESQPQHVEAWEVHWLMPGHARARVHFSFADSIPLCGPAHLKVASSGTGIIEALALQHALCRPCVRKLPANLLLLLRQHSNE